MHTAIRQNSTTSHEDLKHLRLLPVDRICVRLRIMLRGCTCNSTGKVRVIVRVVLTSNTKSNGQLSAVFVQRRMQPMSKGPVQSDTTSQQLIRWLAEICFLPPLRCVFHDVKFYTRNASQFGRSPRLTTPSRASNSTYKPYASRP
jgi:hypothetical protein